MNPRAAKAGKYKKRGIKENNPGEEQSKALQKKIGNWNSSCKNSLLNPQTTEGKYD